jgi:hypothetical protein
VAWLSKNRRRLLTWWGIFLVLGVSRAVVSKDFGPVLVLGTVVIAGLASLAIVCLYSLRTAGLSVGGILVGLIVGTVAAIIVVNLLPRETTATGSLSVIALVVGAVGGAVAGAIAGRRLRSAN